MEERTERSASGTSELPMVPLRDIVVFPHTMVPFVVGRKGSLFAVERALDADKRLFLATQRNAKVDDPGPDDVNSVGSIATIVQHLKLPNGNVKLLVEGVARARLLEVEASEDGSFHSVVKPIDREVETTSEIQEQMAKVGNLFERFIKYSPGLPYETMLSTVRISDPGRLADTISAHLNLSVDDKQSLLEMTSPQDRLEEITRSLNDEIERLRVDKKIQNRVKKQMEKAQKEYYLNEKIKAIQQELGRRDDRVNEFDELREKVESAKMPTEAKDKAIQELKRFEVMPPVSAEATVSRNYLEWLLAMPWTKRSRELRDINRAQQILDEDHYGLSKVKERILEFLAVRQLVRKSRGSILCFVGPPGVGKTSLARSISRSTGRKFARLSLGGVRDEAEIRGHRRTYIGAFPGQIIQMMRKAGTRNPVFLLDEVDKMAADFRGDPSAALLEVLDPEQNHTFLDHYIDTEYDLSDVMFIATANVIHTIPAALRDRMEVIRLPGYTLQEKLEIAERYLVPKQLKEHGLTKKKLDVQFERDGLREIVERYTKEAGVRNLEREVAGVCRKLARQYVGGKLEGTIKLGPAKVVELLGVPHHQLPDETRRIPEIGVVAGLAWTQTGGEILIIEATTMRGRGRLTLTGQLGEVMQESAQAAMSFIRSRAEQLGIDPLFHRKSDIHVHLPEGAIPKDGPSAGIGLATAIASLLSSIPVDPSVAMTGEITLRGNVLPIGGVKEKVLAAFRYGSKVILLPKENEKDLAEIPEDITAKLDIRLVETMDDVLEAALVGPVPGLGLGNKSGEKSHWATVAGNPSPTDVVKITSCRFEVSAYRPQDEPVSSAPEVVFLGRSNVGKSSLINVLLGTSKMARTSSTPGRTQSVNFYRVNESFRFVDLPGYGYARVPESIRKTWGPMIEGALERRRERIVLAVHVMDARHDPTRLDQVMQAWLKAKKIPFLVAATKADKLSANARARAKRDLAAVHENGPVVPPILVSSPTKLGIKELWKHLDQALSPPKS